MQLGTIDGADRALSVDVLPAGRGDSIWVECDRPGSRPWRLLVDGGLPECWPVLRDRIAALDTDDRHFDLVVVPHIDSDHIGGLLPLLSTVDLVEILSGAGDAAPPPCARGRAGVAGDHAPLLEEGTERLSGTLARAWAPFVLVGV